MRVAVPPLAVVVVVGAAVRTLLAWSRATPFFGDEYTYSTLSRSLATTGRATIRGVPAHFPALLQPLLTAPAWLLGGVDTAYRLTQAIDSLAMSLAAVPVYLLARGLGLGRRAALAGAVLALATPSLIFSSFVLSEPVAYPLALAAVAAAVAALDAPSVRTYGVFLAFAGAAAFARMQLVVLFPCFLVALVGLRLLERRRLARAERRLVAAAAALTVLVLALGPARNTGYYPSAFDLVHVDAGHAFAIAGANLLTLVYGAGFVLVPGALLGLALALARPRTRRERAFGVVCAVVTVALVAQASLYGITAVVQERYLLYLIPLWALCFLLDADRRPVVRAAWLPLAGALVAVVALVPLTGYAQSAGTSPSPDLLAILGLEQWLGSPGAAAGAVLVAVLALTALVASCRRRPRAAVAVALAGAALAMGVSSTAAYSFDLGVARTVARTHLGTPYDWVAAAGPGPVSLLLLPGYDVTDPRVQLFWNRTVDRVLLYPGAKAPDPWASTRLRVAADGTLLADGRPVTGSLLVAGGSVPLRLRDAVVLGRTPTTTLWRLHGPARR